MDIQIPHSALTQFLKTNATPVEIAKCLSLCGPTVDRLRQSEKDWVYDIEIITNRVDAASAYGIAREAYAILPEFGYKAELINSPFEATVASKDAAPKNDPVKVIIKNQTLVSRFACVALKNIQVKPSPEPTQKLLDLSGQRPLNNIVDITNELTLLYGQPVHVFDLDLIKKQTMIVRESLKGEKILTLDGKTHTLKGGDIVIEDGEGRLIDLCGIMGGGLSAVNDKTKNVLLFVQTYDPKKIRRTSLYTQERTLAAQLFEKQPDPEMVLPVLTVGTQMLMDRAKGILSSKVFFLSNTPYKAQTVSLNDQWLSRFAGITMTIPKMSEILERLGFSPQEKAGTITCTVPSFRQHDVKIKEDLAEEVMRVYGYYRLPSTMPPTTVVNTHTDPALLLEVKARVFIANLGYTEIYNYALISDLLAQKSSLILENKYRLANPLSEEYVAMRPSLIPSLLGNLEANRGIVAPPHRLFELANTYAKVNNQPVETATLAFIHEGESYQAARGYLEAIARKLKVKLKLETALKPPMPFEPNQTAQIFVNEKMSIGYIGLITEKVCRRFQLEPGLVACELNFHTISQAADTIHRFQPVPTQPAIIEDLTFTLPAKTKVGPVLKTLEKAHALVVNVSLKSIYNANYTFTLTYRDPMKALADKDMMPVRKSIVKVMESTHGATLVGTL